MLETMSQPFRQAQVKCLMTQLLEGTHYLHQNWVLHRDLKTSNLLVNNKGEIKICDFGLSRQYGDPLKPYTQPVVTLWYRAPELLLGQKEYSAPIDMWSLGCIMAEMLSKKPLFKGKGELQQLTKIFEVLGTPTDESWPKFSELPGMKSIKGFKPMPCRLRDHFPSMSIGGKPWLSGEGYNLLKGMLTHNPEERMTAEQALVHPWFNEDPLPTPKSEMPVFRVLSERERYVFFSHCVYFFGII